MGNELSGQDQQDLGQAFDARDVKIFYKRFSKLDTDNSGELEPEEFFDVPALNQNP